MKRFPLPGVLLLTGILMAGNPVITDIIFRGHEKTKLHVLTREMSHPVGVPFDSSLAEEGRIRLINLGLFLEVEWHLESRPDGKTYLVYNIIENFRILPGIIPIYSDETGWGLILSMAMVNFRGLNETLQLSGKIGRLSSVRFSFYNPWIYGDHGSLGASAADERLDHAYLPFHVHTREIGLSTGRYWGYEYRADTGLTLSRSIVQDTGGATVDTLSHALFSVSGSLDTRDIYFHPTRGYTITTTFRFLNDLTGDNRHILYWSQDISLFKHLTRFDITLGINAGSNLTFGTREDILIRSLGGSYSIRGWSFPGRNAFDDQSFRFGYQQVHVSAEGRKQITSSGNWTSTLDNLGLEAAVFVDAGWIGNDLDDLSPDRPISGAGFGLRMNFPVVQVIRFDYAWGFYSGKRYGPVFHLGFGQKF